MSTHAAEPSASGNGRLAAPVAYRAARRRLQRYRIAAALVFLGTAAATTDFGEPASYLHYGAAGLLLVDASLRLRFPHRPIWSFLADALSVGAIIATGGALAPLMALLAYLLVGTILYVRQPGTVWTIVTAATSYVAVAVGLPTTPGAGSETAVEAAVWIHLGVMFAAAAILLLYGADHIRTARRQQEEALIAERRASEVKGQFVSMVSHELRTPLTTIAGFADTLADTWRTLDPAEIDEFLGIIRSESDHLGNLVDDVLAIPRLEAGRLLVDVTDFALRPLAFRIAGLVFPASGEREASVQVPGTALVRADPNRVEQVLRNLLDNARKYGGDRVGIEATREADVWTVVVADNGHGVPPEDRERIFEQFEQVSRGDTRTGTGVGLGLSVTRRLVEAMGGRVWYEPGFPVGSRFCFTLPAGTGDETPPADPEQLSVKASE